jgi:hypothetical protein
LRYSFLQDKDATISELNKELLAMKEEVKETNHNYQVMEKRLLKTTEDYEMIKSKFETFKDIEIVSCCTISTTKFNQNSFFSDNARISKRRKNRLRGEGQKVKKRSNGSAESIQAANNSYRQSPTTKRLFGEGQSFGNR